MTQRLKRHPFLALFDGADPNATTADRLETTVPTQALFFLNDPFVHAQAETWAARLAGRERPTAERIDLAWQQAVRASPDGCRTSRGDRVPGGLSRRADSRNMRDSVEARALAAYLRTIVGEQRVPARRLEHDR